MFTVTRSSHNPLLSPVKEHPWEAAAAFNGCPIEAGKKTYIVYRALSEPDPLKDPHIRTSVIGIAESKDSVHFENRSILVGPDKPFDQYGCEDPRVTKLGDMYYIFYTALSGYPFSSENIKVGVALSKDLKTITEKHLVTPFNAKAMALFPQKINGKIAALLTINTDMGKSQICYAEFDRPEDMWSEDYWKKWLKNVEKNTLSVRRQEDDHIELGAAPVKTKDGWVFIYSHIQRYGTGDQVFGIEAALLDLKKPKNIIGRTKGPFIVPETYYEETGMIPHITFPSGALIRKNTLEVWYGGADTHCAMATIPLPAFLKALKKDKEWQVVRSNKNPILVPRQNKEWELGGVLNPGAIDLDGTIHIIYRAVSKDNVSTLGYATSKDGITLTSRSEEPIYRPRADFEKSGCEDPRLMKIGTRIYMTYTGYDGTTPRVAITSISVKDFLNGAFEKWDGPQAITPEGITNKDAAILPEPVNGKYLIFHRPFLSICADYVSSLDFKKEKITKCIDIIDPRKGMWDNSKIGLSTPPIKTSKGWLVIYHGISWNGTYRVGAILLDLKDPTIVISRTALPFFEPETSYERKGVVKNVVFPCGSVVREGLIYIYYGGADLVSGVATIPLRTVLKMLES